MKIIDAINDGVLEGVETYKFKYFNFDVPVNVPGIMPELMTPERGWSSKVEYDETLSSLAVEFIENFEKKFKGQLSSEQEEIIAKASPVLV